MTERETDPTQAAAVTLWGAFDGSAVHLYTLRNRTGVTLRLSDYGAMIVGLDAPAQCHDLTGCMECPTYPFPHHISMTSSA